MKKYVIILSVLLLPSYVAADSFDVTDFHGEWCLKKTENGDDDDYLELKFQKDGILGYRVNPYNEFKQGTFSLEKDTLMLKAAQGINFRRYKLISAESDQFVGKYFTTQTFSRGLCK